MSLLERALVVLASLALSLLLIGLLSGFFTARDRGAVSGGTGAPGQRFADLADALPDPHPRPRLLAALSSGDVVFVYGMRHPPHGLKVLARSLSARATPALVRAGQAVVLRRVPGVQGLLGLAWRRLVHVSAPGDPRLRAFAAYWLGRGAAG